MRVVLLKSINVMKCYDFWAKFNYLNHVAKMNLTSSASLQYTLALALVHLLEFTVWTLPPLKT